MTPEEIKSQIHYIKVLLEVLKKNDEDATITESTDANTKSNYSEEAKYINSLSAEDQNDVENSLTELYDGLSELESVLDLEAYSETAGAFLHPRWRPNRHLRRHRPHGYPRH